MVRTADTIEAYQAIVATLPFGGVAADSPPGSRRGSRPPCRDRASHRRRCQLLPSPRQAPPRPHLCGAGQVSSPDRRKVPKLRHAVDLQRGVGSRRRGFRIPYRSGAILEFRRKRRAPAVRNRCPAPGVLSRIRRLGLVCLVLRESNHTAVSQPAWVLPPISASMLGRLSILSERCLSRPRVSNAALRVCPLDPERGPSLPIRHRSGGPACRCEESNRSRPRRAACIHLRQQAPRRGDPSLPRTVSETGLS
jgi:hypothetical protein